MRKVISSPSKGFKSSIHSRFYRSQRGAIDEIEEMEMSKAQMGRDTEQK